MRVPAACMLLALALAPALAAGQSLGDAARREQERRRQLEAAGAKAHVITDSELSTGRPAAEAPRESQAEPARPADDGAAPAQEGGFNPPSAARGSESDDARGQEDEWRARVRDARNRIERARRRHDFFTGLTMVPGKTYYDESGRAVITSIEQLQQLTAEALRDLQAAEQELTDLEETARRAGVPPGWLRE